MRIVGRVLVVGLASAVVAFAQDGVRRERLTLADTTPPGQVVSFAPRAPSGRFVGGGRQVQISLAGGGAPTVVDVATLQPVEGAPVDGPAGEAEPRGPGRGRGRGAGGAPGPRLELRGGDVVLTGAGEPRPLTSGGGCREAHLAPGGAHASFVRGNDLWIAPTAAGVSEAWRVTDTGGEQTLHGVLDWVYQEEVYGRGNFQGHWWSPTGAHVAFLSLDESRVKPFTVVDHAPRPRIDDERAVVAEVTRYPKAGDPNPVATLSIADVAGRRVVPADLSRYGDAELLLVRVAWTPSGSHVVLQVQDRIQTWLDVDLIDAATGELRQLFRETSTNWVNVLAQPRFLRDGGFLWFSERSGYQNLYRYDADGALVTAVTAVPFNVLDVVRIDEDRGFVWLTGRGSSPIDSHLFRASLAGGELAQLTQGPGVHRATFGDDGSHFLDSVSAIGMLPELRLCDADGAVLATWAGELPAAAATYGLREQELVQIRARDGYPLDATLIRPDEPSAPFPIFVDTYSGPDAPSVRNQWSHSAWHQFLAQEGIGVLQVNVRSASGRGQLATGTCYRQFGVQELLDLEDAVAWACAERGGDPTRVAISGWSYGGFMAAYALTHSRAFALGFAGAGVHDWQLYDTIYTERYMSTPQLNPDGYRRSSVIEAAKDLHGHLVILHGTIDDNVHLQNTIRLLAALQAAGQDDFELMLYPGSRHGVRSAEQRGHMRRLMWRACERQLLGR
ncbi:MAG: S9 family peptidase [Planctomycetes bacterium]|nr:S9 family peptidase [Planctomycetota bacterium]